MQWFSRSASALLIALLAGGAVGQSGTNATYDVLSYVNQLIGSSNGGKSRTKRRYRRNFYA